MKKQKGKFLLFVFSLCPGAGHMYMGLMKMGVSVMRSEEHTSELQSLRWQVPISYSVLWV